MKNFNEELSVAMGKKEQVLKSEKVKGVPTPVAFKRFDKGLPAPAKENERNAGYDLFARLTQDLVLAPGQVARIPLNVAFNFPKEIVGLVFQRSSTFKKWGIKLTNNVGVGDSLYCGNDDEYLGEFRNETPVNVTIQNGDKIAQMVFLPLANVVLYEQDELGNDNRGGFGTSYDSADDLK
jgi:dUTP pyrophosphatase